MSERVWQRLYELVDGWRGQVARYESADCCCCCESRADVYRECAKQLERLLAEEDVPALVAEVERLWELANDYRLHIEHLATILGCIQTEAEALRRLIHEARANGGKARLDDMEKLVQAIFGWLEAKRDDQ